MKICNDCGLEKSIDRFYKKYKNKEWRSSRCIECLIKLRNENIDHYTIINARSRNKPIHQKYLDFNRDFHCIKVCKTHGKLQYSQIGIHLKIEKGIRSPRLYCIECKKKFTESQHNECRRLHIVENNKNVNCVSCKRLIHHSFFTCGSLRSAYPSCKECRLKISKKFEDNRMMIKRYGFHVTIEEYKKLLKIQNNVCAICKKQPNKKRLAIDHCHKTEKNSSVKIRGLLCQRCNLAIGQFEDDVTLMKEAIKYLEDNA